MQARTLCMPQLPLVTIPHPLGGLKPEEVIQKANLAFQAVVEILNKKVK